MKRAIALALVLSLGCVAVAADEETPSKKASAETAAPAKVEDAPPENLRPVRGVHYAVTLKTGRKISGVIRSKQIYEKWAIGGGYEEADPEDRRAGVRLWFPQGEHGFIFVMLRTVDRIEELGEVSALEGKKMAEKQYRAERQAERERERIKKVREAEARARAEVEAAKTGAIVTEDGEAGEMRLDKAATELLVKYPPTQWTPDSPDQIKHRQVVLGLFPTDEEKAFLAVFDEWKKAYEVWKRAKAKQDAREASNRD